MVRSARGGPAGEPRIFHLGGGTGFSVRGVTDTARRVTGQAAGEPDEREGVRHVAERTDPAMLGEGLLHEREAVGDVEPAQGEQALELEGCGRPRRVTDVEEFVAALRRVAAGEPIGTVARREGSPPPRRRGPAGGAPLRR